MRTLIFILFSISCTAGFSQNNVFRARMVEGEHGYSGGNIIFPLKKDTVKIDSSSIVAINLKDPSNWVFYLNWESSRSKIFRFDTDAVENKLHVVVVPDTAFYKHYQEKKMCPVCLQEKYLIPVVHGLPTPKERKLSKQGKIKLGGCIIDEYRVKYYCKKDHFDF